MIIKIIDSPLKNKRYRAIMDNGKKINFGYKFGHTYIDHRNKNLRENYKKRHLGNKTEQFLIKKFDTIARLIKLLFIMGR